MGAPRRYDPRRGLLAPGAVVEVEQQAGQLNMPVPSTFTSEHNETIKRMLGEGRSVTAIAREIGKPRATLFSHIKAGHHLEKTKSPNLPKAVLKAVNDAARAPEPDVFKRCIRDKLPDCILVIPDLQAPFHHPDALPFLSMVAQRYQPDAVVCIGDEMDFGWASRYEKYPEIDEPCRELEAGIKFMEELFKLFPAALALTSNHVHGRLTQMRKSGRVPPQLIANFREIVGAPKGWEWYEEVHLGNVLFRHGDKWPKLSKPHIALEVPRCYGKHMSVVHGHLHEQHGRVGDAVLVGDDEHWAAYTGCLVDPRSKAFDYTKAPKVRLGCLVIVKGVPHRIPLRRNEIGRWTGSL